MGPDPTAYGDGAPGGVPPEAARRARSMAQPQFGPLAAVRELPLAHHFTVDVEEYFQVSAFEGLVSRASWSTYESRVSASVARLLELLALHGARGTFFVLGWVAERLPALVREIGSAGHEIASHGWDHRRVTQQTPAEFLDSVTRTRQLLEALGGVRVRGFRAPSYSITGGREWALDALLEAGYTYDSSLFPVRRPGYGYAGGLRDPHWIERPGGRIAEVPPLTLRRLGVNLPAAGGAYFRLFPYRLVRMALRETGARGVPGTFYIHPWELDPEQPRLPCSWPTRVRHYGGLRRTRGRLERLLGEFRFRPIGELLVSED
jgi:polysaccharide deacetylase family protein (PEP-CTERM system associated)